MMSAYERLNQLAAELISDGKSPNLYFVSEAGTVVTITTDRRIAYLHWRRLADEDPDRVCTLEDREHGMLASIEPNEDGQLRVADYYAELTGDYQLPY